MKITKSLSLGMVLAVSIAFLNVYSQASVIEPDLFPEGTDLSQHHWYAELSVTSNNNRSISGWKVTANTDGMDFAPTGEKVFGNNNVYFWNTNFRLRVDFDTPTSYFSIIAGGSKFFDDKCQGVLEAYNMYSQRIDTSHTYQLGPNQSAPMYISRSQADIAYVVAYTAGENPFGRLDRMEFTVVPEPATLSILILGAFFVKSKRKTAKQ